MAGVSLTLAVDRGARTPSSASRLFRTVADESELLLIAVLPDEQRRGIGRCLLEDFLERAREDGVSRVHLEVRDGNPAIGMYRAAGFSPVGRRRNYYHAPGRQQVRRDHPCLRTLVKHLVLTISLRALARRAIERA